MSYVVIRDWRQADDLIRLARAPCRPGDRGDLSAYVEFERMARKCDKVNAP